MPFHSRVKHVTLVCVPMVGLSLALSFMNEALYCRVPWRVVVWDDCGHRVASQENKTLFRKRTYAWVWWNREFRRKSPTHVHLAPNLVIHQLYLCLSMFFGALYKWRRLLLSLNVCKMKSVIQHKWCRKRRRNVWVVVVDLKYI